MQSQGLGSILVVVGEDQFIIIYEDGIYKSVDNFFFVIEVVDVAVLSLRGDINPDNVMIIISMVVSFYFGTQHEKKA